MGNGGPWLAQCERMALFAREFYEREGDFAPLLDVLTADGHRRCVYVPSADPPVFIGTGGFWYGRLWRVGGDGRLQAPTEVAGEAKVMMDVLLVGGQS